MAPDGGPWIEVEDLHHTYLKGTPLEAVALRGVSLKVWPGEIVGLVGPTGSGKSTLLQHLNGLYRPQQGVVRVFGMDLGDPSVDMRQVRRRVGHLFQYPEDQLFEQYAGDDVAFGPRNMGWPLAEIRARVKAAMDAVGLPFGIYKNRLTLTLSGGERRRLALAGVLALEPQVLLLDEPTAGLDPQGHQSLLSLLVRWRDQGERAIVLASHNMDDLVQLADRLYVLVDGQIVREGTPREVFSDPNSFLGLGLGLPSTTQVVRSLQQRGCRIPETALTMEEVVEAVAELIYHV